MVAPTSPWLGLGTRMMMRSIPGAGDRARDPPRPVTLPA